MDIRGIETAANALRRPLDHLVEASTTAEPHEVYAVLADLQKHLDWAGERAPKTMRLTAMDAPPGPAVVGTEFTTTGKDPNGTFTDRSVVTEAAPGRVFEFVTEAVLTRKRDGSPVEWTVIHRYEIVAADGGSHVSYRFRVTRISRLTGPLRLLRTPLAGLLGAMWRMIARRGLRNLTAVAEGNGA